MMDNILTVDVEGWLQSSLDILGPEYADLPRPVRPGERVVTNLRWMLTLFAEHDVRATCFVLGSVAEAYPDLIREIDTAGHEIATHGYSHELIYTLTPEAFRADIEKAIQLIQDAIGNPQHVVRGYRAPCFSITPNSEWALDVLADLGLEYDSSIFPIRRKLYGFPGWEGFPHTVRTSAGPLIELPISTICLLGQHFPIGGGGYFRLLPYSWVASAIRAINRQNQPAVFYLHPYELDTEELRYPLPHETRKTHLGRLTQRMGRKRVEAKLHRLLTDFRWASVQDWIAKTDSNLPNH